MKKFEDLTPEDKKKIGLNGCGPKGGRIKPPHAIFFHASCLHHDWGYWKGCTEEHREICDKKFYDAMVKDCSGLPMLQYLKYKPWCFLYYVAVRNFGKPYFYYAYTQREIE